MYICVLNSGVDGCGHLIEHNVIMRFANCGTFCRFSVASNSLP